MDNITVNRNPSSDSEVSNEIIVDDSLGEGNILRLNQLLENYLKVSVGNDVFIPIEYDKKQTTDKTIRKYPNSGGYLLQQLTIKCNNETYYGKIQNFINQQKHLVQQETAEQRVYLL